LSGVTGTFTAVAAANGWSTAGASRTTTAVGSDTLLFTKTASGAATDLAVGGQPTIATTDGGTGALAEQAEFTFTDLTAGKSFNIGGLMFTAGSTNVSAANVAAAFANLANGATTGAGTAYGSYSGQLTGYTTSAASGSALTKVTYSSVSPGVNVDDLSTVASGSSITVATNTAGTASTTEVQTVTFASDLLAGRTATIAGLTITAGSTAITQAQLAAAFSNLTSGVTGAQLNANGQGGGLGIFSGTFTGWNTGSVSPGGTSLVFTSTLTNQNRDDIALTASETAITPIRVQGTPGISESASVTFAALAANQSLTMGGLTFKAGGTGATADEVATAFQNLTSGDAPTSIAARNETATATFAVGTLAAGETLTLNGLTWTAGTNGTSRANLLAVFGSLAAGTTRADANTAAAAAIAGYVLADDGEFTAGTATVSASSAAVANVITFTATNSNVTDLVAAGTNASITITTATTQQGMSAAGTYSGTFTGWNTGASSNAVVGFTSTTGATNVQNLSASSSENPTVTIVTNGVTAARETARATFRALAAGEITTLNGKTFTAGASGASAADVASSFTSGGTATNGVLTGSFSANWTAAASVTNTNQVIFTAASDGDYTGLASPVAGQAPVIVTTQQGGSTSSTETAAVTFNAANMVAGDSVTLAGLTFTAGANGATRAQVAAAFSGLAAGTSSANLSSANGTFSGTLTGWSTGASNGTGLTATSSTASQDVTNITASAAQRSALNALSGIVVGGLANQTGENLLTLRGTVNGNLETSQIKLKDNAANTSQILDFSKFGIQFTVDSFQAQSASDIGAALASLNSSSPSYGSDGAFKPGQIVVSNGANSALKFQSGADSEAFIQIDTLNIQTGKTGIAAGSDATMMAVGDAISGSATGNLGGLGVNDSINSWQTAFRNASAAVDAAIDYISSKRATFGSQMSRLGFITTNLTAQSTNLQNSRSAIIDTDFASETAKLTKGQIMQQAATAMLAQANQMPNVILSLLK
jgi:hypothetical protein